MKTDWMNDAACRRIPDLPWTADKNDGPTVLRDLMASICAACPVRDACVAYVVDGEISGGYWAGRDRSINHGGSARRWVQDPLFGDVA